MKEGGGPGGLGAHGPAHALLILAPSSAHFG